MTILTKKDTAVAKTDTTKENNVAFLHETEYFDRFNSCDIYLMILWLFH